MCSSLWHIIVHQLSLGRSTIEKDIYGPHFHWNKTIQYDENKLWTGFQPKEHHDPKPSSLYTMLYLHY